jgi:formylglycine-generating enzyme required for sulfatase activity
LTTETPSPTVVLTPTEIPVIVNGSNLTRLVDGMVMVHVPEGEFSMGNDAGPINERPLHDVSLTAFWIDQTEVTNAMFALFIETTGYQTKAEKRGSAWVFDGTGWSEISGADWQHPQGPATNLTGLEDHPVVNVSWYDAKAYCEWNGARLPSEAEWEKAARGVDGRTYPWGEQAPAGNLLNFGDVNLYPDSVDPNLNDGYKFTAPVGSYPSGASPYGALDMAGNVWEWVNDWYQEMYYTKAPASDPVGPNSGEGRIFRGGSWNHNILDIRSSIRMWSKPSDAIDNVGFRCAISHP